MKFSKIGTILRNFSAVRIMLFLSSLLFQRIWYNMCYATRTLSHCFIVGHVHDELIIECSREGFMDAVCEQMGRTPPWVPGLILNAAGFEAEHYKKDD